MCVCSHTQSIYTKIKCQSCCCLIDELGVSIQLNCTMERKSVCVLSKPTQIRQLLLLLLVIDLFRSFFAHFTPFKFENWPLQIDWLCYGSFFLVKHSFAFLFVSSHWHNSHEIMTKIHSEKQVSCNLTQLTNRQFYLLYLFNKWKY